MALSANQIEILLKARDTASSVIKKVGTSMKALGNTAKKVGSTVLNAFGSIAKKILSVKTAFISLAGAAGIGYAIKQTYSYIDSIGKTSAKLGVATEELQKFRYAAQLSGVETTTMDMALQRFTRRAAEAAKGTGEAKDALAQMGIKLQDTNGRMFSTENLLGQVAEAFTKVKDPSEKLRLAFKLFDSEGVAMVNMLNSGKAGLLGMTSEAERLGFILSENTIQGVERANNAFTAMSAALGGVWSKLVAALAPALEGFGNWWAEFIGAFSAQIAPAIGWINSNLQQMALDFDLARQFGAQWGQATRDWLIKVVERMREWFGESGKVFKLWEQFKNWMQTDGRFLWNNVESGARSLLSVLRSLVSIIDKLKAAWKWLTDENIIADMASAIGSMLAQLQGAPPREPAGLLPSGSRASGGGVMAGRSYMVGEKGPEIFSPDRSGVIGQTGGQTIINNIYTAATAHGINNALASRGDSSTRSTRIGMTVGNSRSTTGFGNVSTVRAR
jgi:hypothetical protein